MVGNLYAVCWSIHNLLQVHGLFMPQLQKLSSLLALLLNYKTQGGIFGFLFLQQCIFGA